MCLYDAAFLLVFFFYLNLAHVQIQKKNGSCRCVPKRPVFWRQPKCFTPKAHCNVAAIW